MFDNFNIYLADDFGKVLFCAGFFLLSFFLSSSGNLSTTHISGAQRLIWTKLGQRYRGHLPFMSPDRSRVRGHVGVTGSKTRFSRKTFQLDVVSRYGRQIFGHDSSRDPLQTILIENFVGGQVGSRRSNLKVKFSNLSDFNN